MATENIKFHRDTVATVKAGWESGENIPIQRKRICMSYERAWFVVFLLFVLTADNFGNAVPRIKSFVVVACDARSLGHEHSAPLSSLLNFLLKSENFHFDATKFILWA